MTCMRPAELSLAIVSVDIDDDHESDDVALLKSTQPEHANGVATASSVASTHRVVGLGYIVFGALNMSLVTTCIKFATYYVTSREAAFWRSVLSFGLNYLLLLRCILGTLSICFQFYALSKIALTDAVMIVFTSPVLTFLLGAVPLTIPSFCIVRLALVAAPCFARVGLLAITIGFQREKAGIASVMWYFDVIFVILWDVTVLDECPHELAASA